MGGYLFRNRSNPGVVSHAILSPSGASRWLACTPSARLEAEFPNKSSVYADEGTLAHAIGELYLLNLSSKDFNAKLEALKSDAVLGQHYSEALHEYAEEYANFVLEQCTGDFLLLIEKRLDMTNYVPEGFGTADALVLKPELLIFNDLKFGKGVRVEAVNNKQLMLYALGAINDYGHLYDVKEVQMNIYQPRMDNISSWSISVKDLLHWAETELKEKALLAFDGKGEYVPGNHCGFCRAKPKCKALAVYNLELAKLQFSHPDLLTDEELAEILSKEKLFRSWIEGVNEYALTQALEGKKWPGYKLVEGRSNRKYNDEKQVAETLLKNGISNFYSPAKLLGLGALEKAIGKNEFAEYVIPLLIKPAGKPALVPATDPREEYNAIDQAFANVEI
jgi:hypothetical protein